MALHCNKSIPGLLHGITSKHNGDYYCLNCFRFYRTAKKLGEHEDLFNNNGFCLVKMPEDKNKFISSTLGKKTLKNPFYHLSRHRMFIKTHKYT